MRQFKIIVEKHSVGYIACPLGLHGVVVGEGNTYEETLADAKSAVRFRIETFGLALCSRGRLPYDLVGPRT